MKNILLSFFLLFVASALFAQEDVLPRGFSEQERIMMQWEQFTIPPPPAFAIEAPPPYPVRHMAEWEEIDALAVTWRAYTEILTQLVYHAALEVKVLVMCNTEAVKNSAQNSLQQAGVNMANVEFVIIPNDSVWIRDYGPNSVYSNDVDSLYFIDWVYNRPTRPKDDALPGPLGTHLGIPVYSTTQNPERLVNTGGNFMSDGLGTAFASKLILDENDPGNPYGAGPHSEQEIDQIMQDYMGLDRYIKMETLPYDAIHHIDMHMRLLDEETLLVGQYPTGMADGPQIEANVEYVLNNFNSSMGTPYKVVRVVQPPDFGNLFPPDGDYRTYTNAVFVNKTIIIPGYAQQYDTVALRVYREFYPGYKVVSINCNDMIGASGALHCITKEVGSKDPLWIVHPCKRDSVADNNDLVGYDIKAQIKHRTGISSAEVFYTTDTLAAYQSVAMQPTSNLDEWSALIPHQPNGSQVYYYVSAMANSGKVQVRPLVAPEGYCRFGVNDDVSSVGEVKAHLSVKISPNPASAVTMVELVGAKREFVQIDVVDVLGKNVKTIFEGQLTEGANKFFFDAGAMASGIYFATLKTAAGIATQRFVVE